MCGIAGIYSRKEKAETGWISSMNDVLRHRGPDDEGFLAVDTENKVLRHLVGRESKVEGTNIDAVRISANLLLGHRRLSILDPSPLGHQPMSSNDGSLWIVFNGEIYNYIELRDELRTMGHEFRTSTDTEVLLASYEKWGEACLSRLNGMWSFVIYDRRENILFGARDRFGVKPFYYYADHAYFAFASEIKALIGLPFIKKEINPRAVFDYLALGFEETEEEGFFKNILELKPAFAFKIDLASGEFRKWKYYALNYTDRWERFNEQSLRNYSIKIKELLFNAVTLRLRSDVPVGTCLSGGLDSSTIVCIISSLLEKENLAQIGEHQKVFTACYEREDIDERKWAGLAVEKTGSSWFQTFPDSNGMLNDLHDLVYSQDIPFGSTSIYAQYRVMKLAHEQGIKVLLDGQGGDELFSGYTPHYGPFFMEIIKHRDITKFIEEWTSLHNAPTNKKMLAVYIARILGALIIPDFLKGVILKKRAAEHGYINEDFWETYGSRTSSLKDRAKTSLNHKLYESMISLSLKTLLKYEDRNSMRFSIESRTPFADDINLIEYIFQIPAIYKIYKGWSKYLLRETGRGVLPEEIRLRKDKIGFATPEYYWLIEKKNELRGFITSELNDFINVHHILRDWDSILEGQPKIGITNIWKFINLAVWKRAYSV